MPPRNEGSAGLRAAVSVTQMAKMLGMSRAAFYAHIQRGTFLAPVYTATTRRPIYTREMQARNLEVKATQEGINGEFVLFYEHRPRQTVGTSTPRPRGAGNASVTLRRGLEGLGLVGLTDSQIEQAHAACYPQGTANLPESEILRVIYRHLRRSGGG